MNYSSDNTKRAYFRMADLIPLAVIVLSVVVGLVFLLSPKDEKGLTAVVSVEGEIYTEIALDAVKEPYELTLHGDREAVLLISSDGVRFVTSDCPDKLCVNTGMISRSGQSAVCLPARVSVKLISSEESGGIDAVSG